MAVFRLESPHSSLARARTGRSFITSSLRALPASHAINFACPVFCAQLSMQQIDTAHCCCKRRIPMTHFRLQQRRIRQFLSLVLVSLLSTIAWSPLRVAASGSLNRGASAGSGGRDVQALQDVQVQAVPPFTIMYGGNGGHNNGDSDNDGSLVIVDQNTGAATLVGHPAGVSRLIGIALASSRLLFATTISSG